MPVYCRSRRRGGGGVCGQTPLGEGESAARRLCPARRFLAGPPSPGPPARKGPGAQVERRSVTGPLSPSEAPFAPSPIDLYRHFRTPVNTGSRRRTDGAGVESFPRTLPQSLCHSRNAATGREQVAHVAEAAGPPRPIFTQRRHGHKSLRFNEAGAGTPSARRRDVRPTRRPPLRLGPVPSTYKVRTAPLSDNHDVSEQRVEELRTALEAVGARSIDVSREVTFELDAQRGSDAMADVTEVLFALSWPPAVTASIVR